MVHFTTFAVAAILACSSVFSAPLLARHHKTDASLISSGAGNGTASNSTITGDQIINGTDVTASTNTTNTTSTSNKTHKGGKKGAGTTKAKAGKAGAKGKGGKKTKGKGGAGTGGNSTTTDTGTNSTTTTVDTNTTTSGTVDSNTTISNVTERYIGARDILVGATRVARIARYVDSALGLSPQPKRRLLPVPIWEKENWVDRDAE